MKLDDLPKIENYTTMYYQCAEERPTCAEDDIYEEAMEKFYAKYTGNGTGYFLTEIQATEYVNQKAEIERLRQANETLQKLCNRIQDYSQWRIEKEKAGKDDSR